MYNQNKYILLITAIIILSFIVEHKLNELCASKEWTAVNDLMTSSNECYDVNTIDAFCKTPVWWVVQHRIHDNMDVTCVEITELLLSLGASLFCGQPKSDVTGKAESLLEYFHGEFDIDQLVYTAVMCPTPLPPSTNMVPTFFSKLCFFLAGWDDTGVLKVILSDLCHAISARQASVASTKRIVPILGAVSPNFFIKNVEFVYETVPIIHSKVRFLRNLIRDKTSEVPGLKPLCIHSVRNRCKHIAKGRSIIPTIRQLECTVPKSIVHDLLLTDEFHGWDYEPCYDYVMTGWNKY